jgi:cathepsin F
MRSFLALCLIIAVALGDRRQQFLDFQHTYNKSYAASEFGLRFKVFCDNLDRAAAYQARETGTARYGVTKFSDLTAEEFRRFYLMPKTLHQTVLPQGASVAIPPAPTQFPTAFDWNNKGAITPVYNQQQCGSCWAFSATETIESYHFLKSGQLASLSMQQIVDCDTTAYGCGGGWTYSAYQYVQQQGGIDNYNSYPYTAQNGNCNFQSGAVVTNVATWNYITQSDDENAMQSWTYQSGPLSVCVDASSWSAYQGGVIQQCGQDVDHCVQLTGFSTQQGIPAWNVRNSWGTDWGNNGYLWVARGNNVCAIGSTVTVVPRTNAPKERRGK